MKTKNKFNDRLLKFAKHIEKITNHREFGLFKSASFVELEQKKNTSFLITFHEWVFDELPAVFKDWYFGDKTGAPIYKGCLEEEGTVASVIDFFDLKMTEFTHLFDLEGFQDPAKYGGDYLNFDSDGPELAKNIYDLVAYRMKTIKK